ncbi:MAG TPA: CoB--CoM heterodisulfide reductase iron-sulfur subunit B family protein [candidate division Zixibacteria bacterium]|nr:CoB--CoM heterodisulfide reductase iron-sulfur subunit B family protein [candidate division Zixibacteria bacterium]
MKIAYYPGCTLKTKARNLEKAALASFKVLGIEVEELPRWNCCGAVYSLADDDLIHIVAPVRDLVRAQQQGAETVLTLCAMCYNTLARANDLMKNDEEKRDTINRFMDEEPDYFGEVKVVHLLDYIRDDYGFEKLAEKVVKPLKGIKVAPYYGCTLLRPREVALDKPDQPELFQKLMETLGAEVIEFPSATTCCGTYQVLGNPEAALDVSHGIITDAVDHGANAMALACPLCDYNLGKRQDQMKSKFENMPEMPIYYVSQLLAIALGIGAEECDFDLNRESSLKLLQANNLISA